MFSLAEPPLFTRLRDHHRILVAGAGGGFDVYAGLPLAHALRAQGKQVHLANLAFSDLDRLDIEGTETAMDVVAAIAEHRSTGERRRHRVFPH